MLMCGRNIQSPADPLLNVREDQLYHALVTPKPQIASRIEQLRTIYQLDSNRYSQLKRMLPYIVCAKFNPAFRHSDNFAYTERFILDFDHLGAKQLDITEVRKQICADPRVMMCFASPSRDGLKVMFALKERCYDKGVYSLFYKEFAPSFAKQMELEQVLDARTSDVARACFISVDVEAYFNPDAETVDLSAFVNPSNPLSAFDLMHRQIKPAPQSAHPQKTASVSDPTADVMAKIRQTLRPNAPQKKNDAFVPEQLNHIIDPLCLHIREKGIDINEVVSIQYGKKIRAHLGMRQAEVNVFFGKAGFSVVISPRRGTDGELNSLLADVAKDFLATIPFGI